MSNRIIVLAVILLCVTFGFAANAASAPQAVADGKGPVLGKWQFAGKDNTGLAWTGTLTIDKLDPARFDVKSYYALCSVEVESTDPSKGTRGVEAPCKYDPSTRTVSFTTGAMTTHVYTAVLSADGKSLTDGKWTETRDKQVVRSGEWTAKAPAR
jgi:hypothetical protein